MDSIGIRGGARLVGQIPIGGAKNAALPLLAAGLLTSGRTTLANVPALADIDSMLVLLEGLGVGVSGRTGGADSAIELDAGRLASTEAPYDAVRKMRASVLVLGPLLARRGRARVSLPGGCAIGNRPVDLHLAGLRRMGAAVDLSGGYIEAAAPGGRLRGARIVFPAVSVGATENLMMAAALARGETELVNAAREPEIVALGECLAAMGAGIEGLGTGTIRVQGADALDGASRRVPPDRIEAGTYAIAACATGGDLELLGARAGQLDALLDALRASGATVAATPRGLRVRAPDGRPRPVDAATAPYPGFPTDLQAQFMAYMTRADGAATVVETIFENRFMHVSELARMGADISVRGASALVRGVPELAGAPVMATDLRASVSLVVAGLAARGETVVNRVYHLDRGYERLAEKLRACGAAIGRTGGAAPEPAARERAA